MEFQACNVWCYQVLKGCNEANEQPNKNGELPFEDQVLKYFYLCSGSSFQQRESSVLDPIERGQQAKQEHYRPHLLRARGRVRGAFSESQVYYANSSPLLPPEAFISATSCVLHSIPQPISSHHSEEGEDGQKRGLRIPLALVTFNNEALESGYERGLLLVYI